MAEAVAGRVPLVISGHFHETTATVRNGTLFLRIGTTGGSGAGIFRGLDIPFSAEVLYFSRGPDPELIAYDVIEQLPESGSLTVQRVTVSVEFGDLVLTPTPTPTADVSRQRVAVGLTLTPAGGRAQPARQVEFAAAVTLEGVLRSPPIGSGGSSVRPGLPSLPRGRARGVGPDPSPGEPHSSSRSASCLALLTAKSR